MKTFLSSLLLLLVITSFSNKTNAQEAKTTQQYKEMVAKSFENWVAKTGTPFDLLADDVQWTIAGSSAQAKNLHQQTTITCRCFRSVEPTFIKKNYT